MLADVIEWTMFRVVTVHVPQHNAFSEWFFLAHGDSLKAR